MPVKLKPIHLEMVLAFAIKPEPHGVNSLG